MAKRRGPGRPRKKTRNKAHKKEELRTFNISPHVKRTLAVIVFLELGVITILALFDAVGPLGAGVSKVLTLLFGWGAVVVPLLFLGIAAALFSARHAPHEEVVRVSRRIYVGSVLAILSLSGFLHLLAMGDRIEDAFVLVSEGVGGGYFGAIISFPLYKLAAFWGTFIILLVVMIIVVIWVWGSSLRAFLSKVRKTGFTGDNKVAKVKINQMEGAGFATTSVDERAVEDDDPEEMTVAVKSFTDQADDSIDYKLVKERFKKDNWEVPSADLLEESHSSVDSGNIEANVKIIQKTLVDFGIQVEMGEVNVGPTVTQYTLRPAEGIKLSQILALQNDLALALAASSIRIEAPIPGRALVGIEVPNKSTAIVRLKDIVQSESFVSHESNLAFALGRDVAGHAMIGDLAMMPHLLIAGATGTGKSVAINSLLISLLFRNSPEELRLIIIDPKRVELTLYGGIPHLLTPVVIDHDKAINSLKWAVSEMDRRYELLSEARKRNIGEYNKKAAEKMPYIVIVVDELADLMSVAQADVEAAVVRLAQMARAVGIHLVLATQRPSVDIITGLIKANITSRMAFAVASQVDSRTILDVAGADKLLGNGDMLYITAELGKPKRIQSTFISEKEVRNIVKFLRNQAGEVEYSEEILEKQKSPVFRSNRSFNEDEDEILQEAIEEVKRAGKASASLLQRRLRVGYARAARLLDLMEERGIVGPADGAKPRDVYISQDEEPSRDEEV